MRMWMAALCVCFTGCAKAGLPQTLGRDGFTPVVPPTSALEVGTVVARTSKDPLVVKVVCQASDVFGDLAAVTVAEETGAARAVERQRPLPEAEVARIRASSPSLAGLASVQMRFDDAMEWRLDPEPAMVALVQQRSDACEAAIRDAVEAELSLTLITAAVRANVTFEPVFGESTPSLGSLAAALGIPQPTSGEGPLQVVAAIAAVQDDPGLAVYEIDIDRGGVLDDTVPVDDDVRVEVSGQAVVP